VWTRFSLFRIGTKIAGFCGHGNESWDSINGWKLLLSNCQLIRKVPQRGIEYCCCWWWWWWCYYYHHHHHHHHHHHLVVYVGGSSTRVASRVILLSITEIRAIVRRLVADFPLRLPWFRPGPVHVGVSVGEVALEPVSGTGNSGPAYALSIDGLSLTLS
jgi:hypothetical protein